jgi:hypothetical protein
LGRDIPILQLTFAGLPCIHGGGGGSRFASLVLLFQVQLFVLRGS